MKRSLIGKVLLIVGLALAIGACGSIFEKEPVGIGPDISELKRSPCACMQLKLPAELPVWMTVQG